MAETTFLIAVLPGDGIGVEVTAEAMRVLRKVKSMFASFGFRLEEHPAGARHYLEQGTDMPESTWDICRRADAIFLGAMGLPDVRRADGTEIAPQLDLRVQLDLYAGVRPVVLFHETHSPLAGVTRPRSRVECRIAIGRREELRRPPWTQVSVEED